MILVAALFAMPGKKGKKPNSGLGRAIVRSQRVAKDRARERCASSGLGTRWAGWR